MIKQKGTKIQNGLKYLATKNSQRALEGKDIHWRIPGRPGILEFMQIFKVTND